MTAIARTPVLLEATPVGALSALNGRSGSTVGALLNRSGLIGGSNS